ncbi:hypothetical protein ABE67_16520 [Cytobacillus firmus]|nr:hypothetical protein [Cytobacillus firmus]
MIIFTVNLKRILKQLGKYKVKRELKTRKKPGLFQIKTNKPAFFFQVSPGKPKNRQIFSGLL